MKKPDLEKLFILYDAGDEPKTKRIRGKSADKVEAACPRRIIHLRVEDVVRVVEDDNTRSENGVVLARRLASQKVNKLNFEGKKSFSLTDYIRAQTVTDLEKKKK